MIEEKIRKATTSHDFVGIVCIDGHEHTIKAFGEICGTPFFDFDSELENQIMYCEQIANGYDVEILTADSIEDAVEKDIIDCFNGEYFVK